MPLRPYQTDKINRVHQRWREGFNALVGTAPTGSGKTLMLCNVAHEAYEAGHRSMIIIDQIVLADQWKAAMVKTGVPNDAIGILRGSATNNLEANIIIASAQTISSRRRTVATDEWLATFKVIAIDEAHIVREPHRQVVAIAKEHGNFIIGLTATPENPEMRDVYDDIITAITIPELIEQGYLVGAKVLIPSGIQQEYRSALATVRIVAGEYQKNDLSNAMSDAGLMASAVKAWQQYNPKRRPTLAFCVDKNHAYSVYAAFKAHGVSAAVLVEDTPLDLRKQYIDAFECEEISVLVSVNILSIGFDAPIAEVGLMLRPTKSQALWIQQVGRLLRPYEGKEQALILDLAGVAAEICHPEDYTPPVSLDDIKKKGEGEGDAPRKICDECSALIPVGCKTCPECGADVSPEEKPDIGLGSASVQMSELGRRRRTSLGPPAEFETDLNNTQTVYRMFLHMARERRYDPRWAYHRTCAWFIEKKGRKPLNISYSWIELSGLIPAAEVIAFDTEQSRRYAKKKSRETASRLGVAFKPYNDDDE